MLAGILASHNQSAEAGRIWHHAVMRWVASAFVGEAIPSSGYAILFDGVTWVLMGVDFR
jgi:hypothetical protein